MKKTLGFVGSALVVGLASTAVQASENLFGVTELASGYQIVAEAETTEMLVGMDGKTMEAKCGAKKMDDMKAAPEENAKAMEGKMKEGKCGEAKCGANKKAM